VIIASSVMTSHSMARLAIDALVLSPRCSSSDGRRLGGLPYLLIAIRRAPTPELPGSSAQIFAARARERCGARFGGFGVGLRLCWLVRAIYGTSYGAMVATKALLFGFCCFWARSIFNSCAADRPAHPCQPEALR